MKNKFNSIIFSSYSPFLDENHISVPTPTQNTIPQWYKDADRFVKNPFTNEYYDAPKQVCPYPKEGTTDDYGKIPTWKSCPALLDAFLTGYVFKTPCDITFFKNEKGLIDVKISDIKHQNFCSKRAPMDQFMHPEGFYKEHFAWFSEWGVTLPEGYSALYMTPMNRFDLPFLSTTGIVDNDNLHLLGSFPFFIYKGWEGTLPAGTPYLQVLPFKREDWKQTVDIKEKQEIYSDMKANTEFYRQPDGGIYKNKIWEKREYK